MELLGLLVERAGETVSKQHLMQRAWPDVFVHEDNLKVTIARLRRVLDADGGASRIATIPGRGYRFVAPVRLAPVGAMPIADPRSLAILPPPTPLFGRTIDIRTVAQRLRAGALVTILGAGGIGKTVVAIAAAHSVAAEFADGAAFIDLTKIGDVGLVPAVFASTLGVAATGDEPLASVINALRGRRKLLIIDNCEHVLSGAAAAIERLTLSLPELAVLATSREPLRLRHEHIYRLDTLQNAPDANPTAADAMSYPAVELFVARASERAGYAFTDADAPLVAELCRRLDGMPLAIELAATQTVAHGAEELLAMLEDRIRLLSYGPRQSPLRQQTLLATLDWSYNLLSDHEAALLLALAVFMGPFDLQGALAVADADAPALEVADSLSSLSAKSLLVGEVRGGAMLYRLLETTRAYCLERLQRSGKIEVVRRRHAEYVCEVLERATSDWTQCPSREWGAAYGRILDDMRAAVAWAGRDSAYRQLMIRLTVAGGVLWNYFSQLDECRDHTARAIAELDVAVLAGSAAEMKLQAAFASATMFTRGLLPEALEASRRAHDIARGLGDTEFYLRSLKTLASYEVLTGNPLAAVRRLKHFAEIAASEDPTALPDGERQLAIAEYYLGQLTSSRQRLERIAQQAQNIDGVRSTRFEIERNGVVGCALATVLWLTGFPDRAMRTATSAVELSLASGHELSLSNTLALACQIALWTQHHAEAEQYIEMLERPWSPQGTDFWRRPFALYARGVLACERKPLSEDGVTLMRQGIAHLESANLLVRTPHYLGTLAQALVERGELREAAETIQAARDRAQAQSEHWCTPELLRVHAFILNAQGCGEAAEAHLLSALAAADEIGALSWRLRAANDLAQLRLVRPRAHEARPMPFPAVKKTTAA
jgi:predicted ATPase